MAEDDQNNKGIQWCVAHRVEYCANTDESVTDVLSNMLTGFLNDIILKAIGERIADLITAIIMSIIRGFDELKEESVVLPITGLIPEVGAAIWGDAFEPFYIAFKTVLDPPARQSVTEKIRWWVNLALSQIVPHVSKFIEDELKKGDITKALASTEPWPFKGLDPWGAKGLESFLIDFWKWNVNIRVDAIRLIFGLSEVRKGFVSREESVLNPLYERLSMVRVKDCPADFKSECVAHVCLENERVQNKKCVPCPTGLFRPAGDPASGADTSCASITCGANQHVDSNRCVDCAWDEACRGRQSRQRRHGVR